MKMKLKTYLLKTSICQKLAEQRGIGEDYCQQSMILKFDSLSRESECGIAQTRKALINDALSLIALKMTPIWNQ